MPWPLPGTRSGETDGVHLAEVDLVEQRSLGLHLRHVDLHPVHVAQEEFFLHVIGEAGVGVVADQPRAVGELQDGPHFMEAGRLEVPADASLAREIDQIVFMAEGSARRSRRRGRSRCGGLHLRW